MMKIAPKIDTLEIVFELRWNNCAIERFCPNPLSRNAHRRMDSRRHYNTRGKEVPRLKATIGLFLACLTPERLISPGFCVVFQNQPDRLCSSGVNSGIPKGCFRDGCRGRNRRTGPATSTATPADFSPDSPSILGCSISRARSKRQFHGIHAFQKLGLYFEHQVLSKENRGSVMISSGRPAQECNCCYIATRYCCSRRRATRQPEKLKNMTCFDADSQLK